MGEQFTGSTRIFSLQKMEEILHQGIDPESFDKDGKTFLRHACGDGRSDIVQLLLNSGADPNSRDNEGKTPLMSAAMTGRLEIVILLVEHGAAPAVETPTGDSAIKIAQRWGKKEILQILLGRIAESESHHDAAPQELERPLSGERPEQAVCAPAKEIPLKPGTQEAREALPPKVRTFIPRLAEPEKRPLPGTAGEVKVTATVVDVTVREPESPAQQAGFTMPQLTTDEYIQALEIMIKSPGDRIGILGSLGATGLGAAAGGGIAAVLGATTLTGVVTAPVLGSVALGGWLGAAATTTAVVAAPVTLVIGGAIAVAALGYGISKLIRSGARADVIKEMNINDLQAEIEKRKDAAEKTDVLEDKFKGLIESLQLLVKNNRLDQSDCTGLLAGVENGTISYDYAFGTIEKLLKE